MDPIMVLRKKMIDEALQKKDREAFLALTGDNWLTFIKNPKDVSISEEEYVQSFLPEGIKGTLLPIAEAKKYAWMMIVHDEGDETLFDVQLPGLAESFYLMYRKPVDEHREAYEERLAEIVLKMMPLPWIRRALQAEKAKGFVIGPFNVKIPGDSASKRILLIEEEVDNA